MSEYGLSILFSIKRYLDAAANDSEGYQRAVRLLIQGAALHAPEFETSEYVNFREQSARILKDLVESASPDAAVAAAGAMNHATAEYNRRLLQGFRMQQTYLHEIIRLLSATISELAETGQSSAQQLQEVERQIERACYVEDFQKARASLSESLRAIREEFQAQREKSVLSLNQCQRQLKAQTGFSTVEIPPGLPDERTGLPARAEAEDAIRQAMAQRRQAYLAVVTMERYAPISQRYGYTIADTALVFLANHLASRLAANDRFFSWGEATVVAVLDRAHPEDTVKRELKQALSERLETTIHIQNRDVLLPVHAAWLLVPLWNQPSPEHVIGRVGMFLAGGADAKL